MRSAEGATDGIGWPSARQSAAAWSSNEGALWLLGGLGVDSEDGGVGALSDLWVFVPSSGHWGWQGAHPVTHTLPRGRTHSRMVYRKNSCQYTQ